MVSPDSAVLSSKQNPKAMPTWETTSDVILSPLVGIKILGLRTHENKNHQNLRHSDFQHYARLLCPIYPTPDSSI
jgi:hypothetical protein